MNKPSHIGEQSIQKDGETRTKYQGKTGRDNPHPIPADSSAKDEVFSGPKIDADNIIVTGYRLSPDLPRRGWKEASEFHPAGERAAYIHFGALAAPQIALNEVLPDAVGLGQGEATPFSAQRGEMPEGNGKFLPATTTEGFVEAAKPVKSDVPANR